MVDNSEVQNNGPIIHNKLNLKIFCGCVIYLCKANISKTRLSLLESKIKANGGSICNYAASNSLNYVVVEDSLSNSENDCLNILKKSGFTLEKLIDLKVLKVDWICECLKQKRKVNTRLFEIEFRLKQKATEEITDGDSFKSVCHNVNSCVDDDLTPPKSKKIKEDSINDSNKYLCSQISCNETETFKNHLIINELQELADALRSQGDQWRSHSYDKAIRAIKNYNKEILSYDEAKRIPGIGDRIALKVKELLEEGHLRKVDEICGDEKNKIFKLFSGVWGAGPTTVQAWYRKGYKTLEDLETKATLTKQQKIGLKYYNDIQEKMPRSEVEAIVELVKQKALEINNCLKVVTCGSYRRGKKMCGDVDIVIIKPEKLTSDRILFSLYKELKKIDFISDDLTTVEPSGNDKKYLGLCRLPGQNRRHRRLDIFTVPESESACAIMHYTGSALFNRSIRLLAISKGMCLSEHALQTAAIRPENEMKNAGAVLPTPTEESIFSLLGLEYRPPEQRDH